MVERFNRTIEEMLSKFVAENQRDWDSHLPILMMAYRSAVHETTSFTPCDLMFGRQIDLRIDFSLDDPSKKVVTRTKLSMSNIFKPNWIEFMRLPVGT